MPILFFICLACLLHMVSFLNAEYRKQYKKAVLLKGMASLCFVILGFYSGQFSMDPIFSKWICIGLTLGMIADILLNLRFVFEKKGKLIFLIGILVFLSGHIVYLYALIPYCMHLRHLYMDIGACIIISFLLLKWIFSKITAAKAFKLFGIFYIGAIVLMNCVAFSNMLTHQTLGSFIFMIGAILF